MLARALDALGPEQAEVLADEVGFEYGTILADRMDPTEGHRSVRAALTAVADALTAHGFAAHTEARDGRLAIVSECCPFGETAQQYPHVVCALDRGMIRGMLAGLYGETSPQFETSRPDGGDHCVAQGVSRAYLDHASSSPLRPVALEAMLPYFRDHHADPGRLHAEGHATRVAVEDARERVAARFGARPREVVFTASGTEAVNTAVFGALARAGGGHVVTTAVEHSSVLDAIGAGHRRHDGRRRRPPGPIRRRRSGGRGAPRHRAGVGAARQPRGRHAPARRRGRRLVHELASSEVGAVVHVDACAAAGHVEVDFDALDADLCSITGHTFGGPKGASALLVRRGLRFPPFVVGGAQERARRAGIENVPAIVGFGAACDAIAADEEARERALGERLAAGALRRVDGVERYGDPVACLPHLVCLGVDGVEAEPILLALDQRGVAVHSGSSCSSESLEPSPVLAAMGVDADRSLRASVGWSSTDDDVDAFLDALPVVVGLLRDLRK